jgi:hypothetical protein
MNMKTDLTKILSVSGQHGLYRYIAQGRSGAIVESLSDKSRTVFGLKSRITTLADISVYTTTGEVSLKDVLLKLKEVLAGKEITSKASPDELKELFRQAVPEYDADRFYVSHMKKIIDWYNEIAKYASFDFDDEKKEEAPSEGEAPASEDKANE